MGLTRKEYDEMTKGQKAIIEEICKMTNDDNLRLLLVEQLAKDKELIPLIRAELRKAKKDPEVLNLSVYDILDAQTDEKARALGWTPGKPKSKAEIILERAKEAQAFKNKYPLMPSYNLAAIKKANTNLTDAMQGGIIGEGGRDIAALKDKDVTTFFSLDFQGLEDDKAGALDKYTGIKSLTFEETRVLSRVFSILQYASENNKPCVINGYTIAECMPGGTRMITEAEAEHYNAIIEKFRRLYVTIDATDEMRKRGLIGEDETFELEDFCISALKGKYRTRKGDTKTAYIIRDIPIPYIYADKTNQILSIPRKDFDIRAINADGTRSDAFMSMNAQRQNFVEYLLCRIYIMKHDLKKAKDKKRNYDNRRKKSPELPEKALENFCEQSHVIRFDTLLKACGAGALDRTQAKRVRDFCATALENWKQDGVIKGYSIKAGKDASITITF